MPSSSWEDRKREALAAAATSLYPPHEKYTVGLQPAWPPQDGSAMGGLYSAMQAMQEEEPIVSVLVCKHTCMRTFRMHVRTHACRTQQLCQV